MHVCGITPHDAIHLGHAFMFIAYDVMQRGLVDLGHEVRHVRNVTDVDDPNKRHALGGANSGPHAPRGNAGA